MKIREAIGHYIFSADGDGYKLVAMIPGGQVLEGHLPDFDSLGKQIASVEDQLRMQGVKPLAAH